MFLPFAAFFRNPTPVQPRPAQDEDPDAATLAMCAEVGVRVCTRKGVAAYQQTEWPCRRRCKEGNLSYWYDTVGYNNYDVVAQFDADHVPDPNYLLTALPWFDDTRIGYVACPSICGANREVSWAVRGRLWLEAYLHGPSGAGRAVWALPCCIGSHYIVRTAALRDIGGIGPELDEDFSTSMIMTAVGWKGGFSIDTIANGDGPTTFEDAMKQEFQWARSAMIILVRYTACFWRLGRLSVAEKLHLVYFNWHWFITSAMPFLLASFIWGVAWGANGVQGWQHLLLFLLPTYVAQMLHVAWVRFLGLLRPHDAWLHFLSPATLLHGLCAPFWTAQGVVYGLLGAVLKVEFSIKVTPKGAGGARLLGPRCLAPMLLMSCVSSTTLLVAYKGAAVAGDTHGVSDQGSNSVVLVAHACIYLIAAAAVTLLHLVENGQLRPTAFPGNKLALLAALSVPSSLLAVAIFR